MARILAVDDSHDQLLAIELHLRGDEFEVVTASNGREALDLCRSRDFDLILLDVLMPGIDGFEVCRRLKADPRTAFVPVIFLTGHMAAESARQEAYALGAVDYVQKPANREELLARVRVMLRMEEVRGRLARENNVALRELEDARRALADADRRAADLQSLAAARADAPAGLVLADRHGVVTALDERARALLPELRAGQRLDVAGEAGRRLQQAVADGRETTLTFALGERRLAAERHALGDGAFALRLVDVTQAQQLEARVRDREPARLPPARPSDRGYAIAGFLGSSPGVLEVAAMVDRLRRGRSTVLVIGESGTGKELVARALHFDGSHRTSPFIPIHCGAISRDLIESELFGHEKGAFTGAEQRHEGLFAAADGGTIFLDEIAETSMELQVKLLRVLQLGEVRPVGSKQPRIVDVRIVAATNRDLRQLVREGRFREDLFYRLEVVTLELPPLRQRAEDLPALVEHFLAMFNRRYDRRDRPVRSVARAAMALLAAYPWPGNVRELENVLDRAFALGVGDVLQVEDLPVHVRRGQPLFTHAPAAATLPTIDAAGAVEPAPGGDLRAQRDQAERAAIQRALLQAGGDKLAAARALGLPRSTFYRRLRELGIPRD